MKKSLVQKYSVHAFQFFWYAKKFVRICVDFGFNPGSKLNGYPENFGPEHFVVLRSEKTTVLVGHFLVKSRLVNFILEKAPFL